MLMLRCRACRRRDTSHAADACRHRAARLELCCLCRVYLLRDECLWLTPDTEHAKNAAKRYVATSPVARRRRHLLSARHCLMPRLTRYTHYALNEERGRHTSRRPPTTNCHAASCPVVAGRSSATTPTQRDSV